ncbi:MAG: hypothetical protein JNM10_01130 [Planctomycetia bacterium]|nr:hypothetical protein [Planctomycetia bacterium]
MFRKRRPCGDAPPLPPDGAAPPPCKPPGLAVPSPEVAPWRRPVRSVGVSSWTTG